MDCPQKLVVGLNHLINLDQLALTDQVTVKTILQGACSSRLGCVGKLAAYDLYKPTIHNSPTIVASEKLLHCNH